MIECISYLWKHISVFKYIDINALIKQEYSGWTNEDRLGWGWTRRGAAHLEEPAEVVAHGPEVGDVLQRGSQLQRDSLRGNWPQRGLHGPGLRNPGPRPRAALRPAGLPGSRHLPAPPSHPHLGPAPSGPAAAPLSGSSQTRGGGGAWLAGPRPPAPGSLRPVELSVCPGGTSSHLTDLPRRLKENLVL